MSGITQQVYKWNTQGSEDKAGSGFLEFKCPLCGQISKSKSFINSSGCLSDGYCSKCYLRLE
ncbi:hypothetical protein A2Z67_04925 [Candidatus Woesebacteria bacterium RBG_13_36_22]|uniref:Uncharacterized protein n=1 Tax=Candidatus Woesebacteria bacterium RBG_13_36_22 TaxID=1802478 RepID=A0A1F7X2D3_9BACT|nr:MAG: hypothetical protein A2Z67_04925 [Candidatus Woesebacteria bacterium RBG_13_36_22]